MKKPGLQKARNVLGNAYSCLSHELPPVGGGGGRVAQDICQELVARGHEVRIITAHLKGLAREETIDGVRVFRLVSGRHFPFRADLIEMAISHNSEYLNAFYDDLHHHRFAAIVARKQFLVIKENEAFAEENNAWTTLISPLLLCEYEPAVILAGPNVQVYVPRAESGQCP